jgi:hypothetical protein
MSSSNPAETRTNGHKARAEHRKESMERAGREVREELKDPTTPAVIAGALVLGAAFLVGVPEAILGAAAGLVVYRTIKRHREHGEGSPTRG